MTQLDVTGPYEVLCRVPQMRCVLLAVDRAPIRTEHGLLLIPDCSFLDAPPLDILLVPGGTTINDTIADPRYVEFVRQAGAHAHWITSVCTGALLLGAAGLLRGFRATTHWRSVEFLPAFGAIPVADSRVVIDRNRVTAAGVSAGIDFALSLSAQLAGEQVAQIIQLAIEYDPDPPFIGGHPRNAPADIRSAVETKLAPVLEQRRQIINQHLLKEKQ